MCSVFDVYLGRRILLRRRQLGLTQKEVGLRCGVSFQQIHKYECAANRVSAIVLWRIAEALECPVDFFFDGIASRATLDAAQDAEFEGGRPTATAA